MKKTNMAIIIVVAFLPFRSYSDLKYTAFSFRDPFYQNQKKSTSKIKSDKAGYLLSGGKKWVLSYEGEALKVLIEDNKGGA